jgi:hypothetical protein
MPWPLIFCFALCLSACTPTFNWRELTVPDTALQALLPCKPDSVTREVDMGPPERPLRLPLTMLGCATGDATFAIATVTLPPSSQDSPQLVLDQWRVANLAAFKSAYGQDPTVNIAPFLIVKNGASTGNASPRAQKVTASGVDATGRGMRSHALYFAEGQNLFYAVILSPHISAEVDDSFFSGLSLR